MASFNRVILVGNLTRDPELRYIPSGTAVSDIGLAVNDRIKRDNQWVDETTFVDVVLWGRTAEVANEYLSKGSSVLIEGRLKLDTWETDGQKRSKMRVVCEKMQMLGGKGGQGGGSSGGGGGARRSSQSSSEPDFGDYDAQDSAPARSSSRPAQSSPAQSSPAQAPEDDIPF